MLTIPVYWCYTEQVEGRPDYSTPDAFAAFGLQHGMTLRGHPLLWQGCIPEWLQSSHLSADEAARKMRDYIQATVGRYRGKVEAWDVVNEALTWNGSRTDSLLLWGTVPVNRDAYSLALGPEYIEMAFRWAHEADPQAKLFYNDYGTEGATEKATQLYELVRGLLARGVPIHGVGFQTHTSIYSPPNEDAFADILSRISALGVEVQLTEVDVDINEKIADQIIPLPTGSELATRWKRQADIFVSVMRACLRVPGCTGFTTWGVSDAHTWLDSTANPNRVKRAPLVFDNGCSPKPAYTALTQLLRTTTRE